MRLAFQAFLLLILGGASRLQAADVRFVQVAKTVWHAQTNTGSPAVQPNGFEFRARVDLTRDQGVSGASVRWPAPVNLTRPLTNYASYWEYAQRFATFESMNFTHPNGAYRFQIQAVTDGAKTNNLTLLGDLYSNPVRIANFAEAQSVNARQDFTLRWDPPGTVASDVMQVRIFQNSQLIFETPGVPGSPGLLSGAVTSVIIPRNTLQDGGTYRAQVIASRRSASDASGYPGVPAWAVFARLTEIPLRTAFPTLDVNWYGIAKVRRFAQNSVLAPFPLTAGGYAFTAFVLATDPLNVQSASVRLPDASSKLLSASGAAWRWTETWDTQPQLDSRYAAGGYELAVQTAHNGSRTLAMSLPTANFPAPPQISNWHEASAIDPARPFALKWSPPAGGTADDFLQAAVRKNGQLVFLSSEHPLAAGALDGRSSSVTLPAGLLQPGEAAELTLTFFKAHARDPFSYPQALGLAALASETRAVIRARGGNLTAPLLSAPRLAGGMIEFDIAALSEGRQCIVQTTGDFVQWTDSYITNAPGPAFLFRVRPNPAQRTAGFRVLAQ